MRGFPVLLIHLWQISVTSLLRDVTKASFCLSLLIAPPSPPPPALLLYHSAAWSDPTWPPHLYFHILCVCVCFYYIEWCGKISCQTGNQNELASDGASGYTFVNIDDNAKILLFNCDWLVGRLEFSGLYFSLWSSCSVDLDRTLLIC